MSRGDVCLCVLTPGSGPHARPQAQGHTHGPRLGVCASLGPRKHCSRTTMKTPQHKVRTGAQLQPLFWAGGTVSFQTQSNTHAAEPNDTQGLGQSMYILLRTATHMCCPRTGKQKNKNDNKNSRQRVLSTLQTYRVYVILSVSKVS